LVHEGGKGGGNGTKISGFSALAIKGKKYLDGVKEGF